MWYSDISNQGKIDAKKNYGCPITDDALVPKEMSECREMCMAEEEQCGCWEFQEQWNECNLYAPYDGVAVNWHDYKDSSNGDAWVGLGKWQNSREPPTPAPTELIQYCVGDDCPYQEQANCNEDVFGKSFCVTFSVGDAIYRFKTCNTAPEDVDVVPTTMEECRDFCFAQGKQCGCWDFGTVYAKCQLYQHFEGKAKDWTTFSDVGKNVYYAGLGEYQEEE